MNVLINRSRVRIPCPAKSLAMAYRTSYRVIWTYERLVGVEYAS